MSDSIDSLVEQTANLGQRVFAATAKGISFNWTRESGVSDYVGQLMLGMFDRAGERATPSQVTAQFKHAADAAVFVAHNDPMSDPEMTLATARMFEKIAAEPLRYLEEALTLGFVVEEVN